MVWVRLRFEWCRVRARFEWCRVRERYERGVRRVMVVHVMIVVGGAFVVCVLQVKVEVRMYECGVHYIFEHLKWKVITRICYDCVGYCVF